MREFLQRVRGSDIQCVEEDFVAWVKHWSWSSASVAVSLHVFLRFADRGLCFFDCHSHPFRKLVDCLYIGVILSEFKAHARDTSGVEQERRLLGNGVDVVVVLELRHG